MVSRGTIVVCSVCVVIAFAVTIYVLAHPPPSAAAARPNGLSLRRTSRAVRLPLYYDENAVFVTDVTLLNQTVSVVVDTGSSHLVVGTHLCSGCCDESRGYIRRENMPPSSGALKLADRIYYGSQQDLCDWHLCSVGVGATAEMPVALVTDRTGTSNYNILGVGFNFSARYDRRDMQALSSFKETIVTFSARGSRGFLLLGGSRDEHPAPQVVLPMSPLPDTCFYGVELHDVLFGNVSVRHLGVARLPPRVIFDTGSNMMDMPAELYAAFRTHVYNSLDDLSLVFVDRLGRLVKFSFGSDVYLWDGAYLSSMVVETSDDSDFIVLGSLFMDRFTFTFDPELRTVGLSRD